MVSYLANLLNMDEKDINKKISSIKEEESFNIHALITLMDTRSVLRQICIQQENISGKINDVFGPLGFTDANENQILVDAIKLRNTLCHEKIDSK